MDGFTGYQVHPAADLFPMLGRAELETLASDIKEHGLRHPIVLLGPVDGNRPPMILDGRNRLRACEIAGVKPMFTEWTGTGSPSAWVVSTNYHRRHLSASQRAMIAAKMQALHEAETLARQASANGGGRSASAKLRRRRGKTSALAAAALHVSARSVEAAMKVERDAIPELQEAVRLGEVSVSVAALVASDLPEDQRTALAQGRKALRRRAKVIREKGLPARPDRICTVALDLPLSALPALTRLVKRLHLPESALHLPEETAGARAS